MENESVMSLQSFSMAAGGALPQGLKETQQWERQGFGRLACWSCCLSDFSICCQPTSKPVFRSVVSGQLDVLEIIFQVAT